ncbi:MAG: EF-hand domain-containing protein [Sphingobium sp.]|nr:EF-hand domain-containing protein [Sphingobium sp.]
MPKISHIVLAAGLLSLSAGVMAQPPAPPPGAPDAGPRMKAPETRPEPRAELKARLEARFDRMDANHDGKIDEKDIEVRRAARIAEHFAEIDTDKDGSISKAEFAAAEERRGPPRFARMESPGRAMLFSRRGREGMMMMRGRPPFAPPPGGFEGGAPGRPGKSAVDRKPGDALTKSDFVNQGLARFDKIDTDHDGRISPAERKAARPMRDPRKMPPPPQTPQSGQ